MAAMPVDRVVQVETDRRLVVGGWTAITGGIGMVIGAVFNLAAGADADAALETGDIAGYLTAADAARGLVVVNLSVWIVAICVLCAGGVLMASTSEDGVARRLSIFAYTTGAGTAVMFFSLWMGVVLGLAPAHVAGTDVSAVALALLHGAVNADWVITVMVLSVGGGFLVLSAEATWAPGWLVRWAQLGFVVGALALVALVTGLRTFAPVDVPIGIGMILAAGIVAVRRS